ncbi:NADPH-dependent FMN reductase [Tsukamurella soli]|uniref:NAD(P)H-dependent oxidoreductase n=1 Tax=Tsukamurella soli TaxID=644556 RepID=A0ABP8JYA5_9ACTN
MNISVVVGNPKAGSRTLALATAVATSIAGPGDAISVIDLAEYTGEIFVWPSERMAKLNHDVATSELAIFGSPTYKAAYTGLLKAFLDRYPHRGLRDIAAIPLMTGADTAHSMAPDTTLRPLLVELGASVPTSSFYFETPHFDRSDEFIDHWLDENSVALDSLRNRSAVSAR